MKTTPDIVYISIVTNFSIKKRGLPLIGTSIRERYHSHFTGNFPSLFSQANSPNK